MNSDLPRAYAIGCRDDQWTATRRACRGVLMRPTLAALETVIEADYRTLPQCWITLASVTGGPGCPVTA